MEIFLVEEDYMDLQDVFAGEEYMAMEDVSLMEKNIWIWKILFLLEMNMWIWKMSYYLFSCCSCLVLVLVLLSLFQFFQGVVQLAAGTLLFLENICRFLKT